MSDDFSVDRVREIVNDTSQFTDAFVSLHEFFLSATQAGFTEKQALYMISMGFFGQPNDD